MLREHLRRLFEELIDGNKPDDAEIAYLNRILQRGHPSLIWEQNQPKFSHQYADDPYAALLLPIALSALNLITRSDLDRLHRCQNNNCIMLFYDTTKSATKRWCSTACMDRERSARRYREAKKNSS
jgi:predicted RNA-binding Zn ribbon-like protein